MNGVWSWLALPISGSTTHALEPWLYWHARLMVLAWGVLLPCGALVARYFKVLPGQLWPEALDNKWWWHAHRTWQWAGMVLASVGAYLVCAHLPAPSVSLISSPGVPPSALAGVHSGLGWALLVAGWLQILGGLLRGSKGGPTGSKLHGDHYDMSPRRQWFERIHKSLGWLALLAAILAMGLGLVLVDAPRWMPLLLALWWTGLCVLAWHWQRQGRCLDTYQAIWGPDLQHPGNQRPPIGWGIHRPFETPKNGQS